MRVFEFGTCPCCTGQAEWSPTFAPEDPANDGTGVVRCLGCGLQTRPVQAAEAEAAWNRRAPVTVVEVLLRERVQSLMMVIYCMAREAGGVVGVGPEAVMSATRPGASVEITPSDDGMAHVVRAREAGSGDVLGGIPA